MFIQPMLLTVKDEPFSDDNYLYEPKMDGHRLLLSYIDGQLNLYTRHGTNCTTRYPELWHPPVRTDVILDGEVISINEESQIDFDLTMRRFQTKRPDKVKKLMQDIPIQFVVFDVLSINGNNVQSYPLWQRKQWLDDVLEENEAFVKIRSIPKQGEALFESIKQKNVEGMVAKRLDSAYWNSRSRYWNKIVNNRIEDIWISGYRKSKFGWTMMREQDGELVPSGLLELGPSPKERQALYQVSQSLIIREDRDFVWLKPRIRARVKHRGTTHNGKFRVPVFDHFIL